jgi:hypothetical protein
MHQAFHAEQDRLIARNLCSCPGCIEAGRLRVKFVAHVGEAAVQRIKKRTQLVGLDVIAVHRMLKNSVPVDEYVLVTEPVMEESEPTVRARAEQIEDDLEGLGPATLYYVDLEGLALPRPTPEPAALPSRLLGTLGVVGRGLPRMLRSQPRTA